MRRVLLSLALLAFLGAPARAGEVEDRQANIARLERERGQLVSTQRSLEQDHQKKLADADKATQQRKFNYREKKAEADAVGQKLNDGQTKIELKAKQILAERTALVAALYKRVQADPSNARLAALYATEKAKLPAPVKRLKIADERIEPTDDPEDLDDKAARLKKSENELLAEIQRAESRATILRSQAKLNKSNQMSRRDPFQGERKGRKSAHGESRSPAGGRNDAETADPTGGGSGGGAPPPAEPGAGGGAGAFADEDANQNPSPTPAGTTPVPTDINPDVTTQYTNVIDQSTIDQLRQMERSSDPEVRARAAEQLSLALKARAEKVKQQRQAIEKRAKQLRGR